MNQKKETRFWLTTLFNEQEQDKVLYKKLKSLIEDNGCFEVKTATDTDTVKIYNPGLAVIFASNEFPARNIDTQTETKINTYDYLNTYIEAYKQGEKYFETKFNVPPLLAQHVVDIHNNFFHVKHTKTIEGWGSVKYQYPIILTHRVIKELGYYSGIVNKVEELVKQHSVLFATFEKCEHNLPPQPINNETDTEKLTAKHYVLAYLFECNANGENYPIGNKKKLESIGNKRIGEGKGNTFYKVFNKIINQDLNKEHTLIQIGGEYWRKAVIKLTKEPELVEEYLQHKHL